MIVAFHWQGKNFVLTDDARGRQVFELEDNGFMAPERWTWKRLALDQEKMLLIEWENGAWRINNA